ncbi:hypothetical protein MAR_031387 [Mya arenaria]|uniref:C-type lectin domain-containing protein n=1 Tax=Mya arenaria TaxID=6604 RepID=A0ABY7F7X7_MYAAR|nr:hypothetical protein MAR_031387 [Mya arenaria]
MKTVLQTRDRHSRDFNAHQPDDHASRHDEDCVIIWHAQHWGWNDANCKLHFHYVCEINADPDIIG